MQERFPFLVNFEEYEPSLLSRSICPRSCDLSIRRQIEQRWSRTRHHWEKNTRERKEKSRVGRKKRCSNVDDDDDVGHRGSVERVSEKNR